MHVIRRRRVKAGGRRVPIVVLGVVALVAAGGGAAVATTKPFESHKVGTRYGDGLQISSDQVIKPIGQRLMTPYGKIMGSSVSADGRYLAASSTDKDVVLQIFDLKTYRLIYTVGSADFVNQQLDDPTVGQEGPVYSPDGKYLWLSQQDQLARFPVNSDGSLGTPTEVPLPQTGPDKNSALPGKPAFSADGKTMYVPINGQNTVDAINPSTGKIEKTWNVGIAPREIVTVGKKLFVSDEGGHRALPGESTINSYNTDVPADTFLGTSTSGAVSVIDTSRPSAKVGSIAVGLHPTALYRRGNALFVANTNSDTVSVVNLRNQRVVQTVTTQPWPESTVGYEPTSMTVTGGRLLVTLGRANAVAVYRYDGNPQQPVSYVGLLPTDYYPSTIATSYGKVFVTNTRGIDARGPELTTTKGPGTAPATGHETHSTTASLTRFTLPDDSTVANYTATVFKQNGWGKHDVREVGGGKKDAPVALPKRIGDPSTIKHVFLLVKENRTYDQDYGDIARGNGDRNLAQFGEKVTPDQHALAKQFGLYDNTYDIGTNSAEGHNWMMQGDNPEYTESDAGEYIRSYDTEDDVLGHQRSGFLWTAAESAGKTARDFGEFTQFLTKPDGATWQKYYCVAKKVEDGGNPSALTAPSVKSDTESPIPSLNAITDHAFPKFDTDIPDQYRYEIWKQNFEKNGPANLNMFWLSSDHTGGPPDPVAQVADNDLAVGKIVDTISHSKYWKSSAIFVAEDDSQDGADHVDGHRAPIQVISPWSIHNKVDSTYYSQISMVRTIEQILGAQPLNEKVAAATPMYDAFTSKPDYAPFNAVPNQTPLTQGADPAPSCGTDTLGKSGAAAQQVNAQAARADVVPASQQAVAAQWAQWATHQRFTGKNAVPDYANPEQMNRFTWYRAHDWKSAYPGDKKIYAPSQVPGAYIPSSDTDN